MPSTERSTIDEGSPEPMMCDFLDRRPGGENCFEQATHTYRTIERPDKEGFACTRHAKWLLDAGLVLDTQMKKIQ